ncbi:Protein HflK [Gammaproteobacteria bacterium]
MSLSQILLDRIMTIYVSHLVTDSILFSLNSIYLEHIMAWNEPGGSRGRDPWSGRNNDNEQGPPDLDEVVRKMQKSLGGFFGGSHGGGKRIVPPSGKLTFILFILLIVWVATGIYVVDQAERGVVLRFGRFVVTTLPGLRWHWPYPIESVQIVNTEQIRNVEIGYRSTSSGHQPMGSVPAEALMLTQDENIIDIKFAVQYFVKEAKDFLYNVKDPKETLQQVTESAVREVIGKSKMDFVLTEGRGEIVDRARRLIQEILDRYQTGMEVTSVNMQDAQPPEEVQTAFADAVKAREDEQRLKNEAETYSNDILPKARGAAARQMEEANGYRARVVASAEGESNRFVKVLEQYEKAPKVTRERLYLETMETVLTGNNKILIGAEGNNLLYLPLDQLAGQYSTGHSEAITAGLAHQESAKSAVSDPRNRHDSRTRGER